MRNRLTSILLVMLCGALSLPPCQAGKIHDAVAKRDLAALERVLKKEPKQVNARCYPDFDTPLHMAVVAGDPAMVKLLLDAGADPGMKQPGFPGFTPVQRAVYLVDGLTHLGLLHRTVEDCLASFHGSKPAAEPPSATIKRARGLFQRVSDDLAAVSTMEKAARLEVLSLLLARKPDLNRNFKGSLPPLHLAAMTGNLEVMRMLMKSGANVNGRDDHQWTGPLSMAVMALPSQEVISALNLLDRLRIIHQLIESGAATDLIFPDAKESEPRTLIELARKSGSPEFVELLENPPPVARKPGKR